MLANEHLIIRLKTIYKAEDKFRLLKVRFSLLKNLLFWGDCVVNNPTKKKEYQLLLTAQSKCIWKL